MKRRHTLAISLLLGTALAAGALATAKALDLGQPPEARASDAEIASKTARLDDLEASLRESLAAQPPGPTAATAVAQSSNPTWHDDDDDEDDDGERGDERWHGDDDDDGKSPEYDD